jgi:hypothetical protein
LRSIAMSGPARTECVARERIDRDAEHLDHDIANRQAAAGLAKYLSGAAVINARLRDSRNENA